MFFLWITGVFVLFSTMDDRGVSLDSSATSDSCVNEDRGPRPTSARWPAVTRRFGRRAEGATSLSLSYGLLGALMLRCALVDWKFGRMVLFGFAAPPSRMGIDRVTSLVVWNFLLLRLGGHVVQRTRISPLRCRVLTVVRMISLRPRLRKTSPPIFVKSPGV